MAAAMASMSTISKTSTSTMPPSTTPAPERELAKRRGGGGHAVGGGGGGDDDVVAYDFEYGTTCGFMPHSLASQNGLLMATTSAPFAGKGNDPYPIYCNGLCAQQGNYLDCIKYKTASVASACWDYGATYPHCTSGMPCWWDMKCLSDAPYCNQNIYQDSVTQFTCATSRYTPITVQTPIKMVSYTPVLADQVSPITSTPEPLTLHRVLYGWGWSLGEFIGICIAVGIALIAGLVFCIWYRCRRRNKQKANYAKVQYMKVAYEHPSPGYDPAYQAQYPDQQASIPASYQHYPQYYNQYQYHQRQQS